MYLNPENEAVRKRQNIEVRIVKQIVKDALAAGYALSVDDGGDEVALSQSTSRKDALDALMNTDEDRLIVERFDRTTGARIESGWVRLVYGNDGWDVINDYTLNLEDVLAGANKLAESLEERS